MSTVEEQIAELEAIAKKGMDELVVEAVGTEKAARSLTLEDFLTPEQIRKCLRAAGLGFGGGKTVVRLGPAKYKDIDYTRWALDEIIQPNIVEINRRIDTLMQSRGLPPQPDNDAAFLAYVVTYVIGRVSAAVDS